MMRVSLACRIIMGLAFASMCVGCNYYKEQTGYLVTGSEAFIHHYEGNPCGLQGKLTCDLPEMRYTFLHNGVNLVAHCQSWEERDKCGTLQVGNAYQCHIEGVNDQFGPQLLSCEGKGTLGIEFSKQN